jgi:quercetin dioxygenase-like cupin family protein
LINKVEKMKSSCSNFLLESELPWNDLGSGVLRQIAGYDKDIMLVKVKFIKGAVGPVHQHYHSQASFVASGTFEVSIKGEKKVMHACDSFFVEPDAMHGVVCLEEGMLIDAFSPAREDFL